MPAKILLAVALLLQLGGCTVNAVTGERNLQFYGTQWEQEVGTRMYRPMKQSQGGEFILDAELTAYVQAVGDRLALQARRKDELQFEFSIINSSVPNAWALPGGKIVVNRGLLTELNSEAELAAVLGHEIVHADAAHGARQQSKGMLAQVGAIASMVVLGSTVENEQAREIAMLVPVLGLQLTMQKYGRDAERESDEYGMRYMSEARYDPQGAVQLQETFVKLSEGRPNDWFTGLFASHPPSQERLENNRKTAATLPPGGASGAEVYQQKTAFLQRVEPAYVAYDEANAAFSEGDFKLAQSKLDEALELEPRESLFHALQGDIYQQRNDAKHAMAFYIRAIKANEQLFYGYLRKGQLEFDQKKWDLSRSSLQDSQALLPTAEAYYLLGLMDRDLGQQEAAMQNFKAAAQSDSEAGKNAKKELVMLDLGQNPGAYIQVATALDKSNTVWIRVGNTTDLAMSDIEVNVIWLDDRGQTLREQRTLKGPLAGGKADRLKLDVKVADARDLSNRVRVEVTAARVAQ